MSAQRWCPIVLAGVVLAVATVRTSSLPPSPPGPPGWQGVSQRPEIRPAFSFDTMKPESIMPSGSNRRSARNFDSGLPDAASTTRPSNALDRLYSHWVPGWLASGASTSWFPIHRGWRGGQSPGRRLR